MKKTFLFLLSLFVFAFSVNSAGSRYVIESEGRGIVDIDGIELKVKIYNEDSKSSVSSSEDVDFKIRNGRDGDKCEQQTDKTDASGNINATCYAAKVGSYNVYLRSNDRGDESADIVLTFDPKPTATPTPAPTATVTPTPEEEEEVQSTIEEENDFDEEPTPTPEVEVAGFFSNSGNLIATIIFAIALAALGFLLVKSKIIDLSKFKKKKELPNLMEKDAQPAEKEENPA